MSALRQFQDAFARALITCDDELMPGFAAVANQPGFAVYRNTVIKGCIDALQANYPSVCRVAGEEWFRAAAAVYVRSRLPGTPMLLEYGADFGAFLEAFEPARELVFLPGVAKCDRFWTEAHVARDEAPLDPACFAQCAAGALARCRLVPHASARWHFFEDAPVATVWRRNRHGDSVALEEHEWHGEGLLIVRPHATVEAIDLDAADCAFLDACADGATLADAAARALERNPDVDLSNLMARLLGAGAVSRVVWNTDPIRRMEDGR
jgi:hypothetical protein